MKKPRRKKPKPPRPRNVAAKALRQPQYRPRTVADPKAYKRRLRHPLPVDPEGEDDGAGD